MSSYVSVAKCIGCPKELVHEDIAELQKMVSDAGWELLPLSDRWRCPECYRALKAAVNIIGTEPGDFVDKVPPHSRGALPKATAHTISRPLTQGEIAKGGGTLDWE